MLLAAGTGAHDTTSAKTEEREFRSRALQAPRRFAVSLPAGYQAGGRYPVVYFLHGLPASPSAFQDIGIVRDLDPVVVDTSGRCDC